MSTPAPTDPDLTARGADATVREIRQQPEVWREVLTGADSWRARAEAFLAPLVRDGDCRIVLTGAGSSAFVGDILAPALGRKLGRRVDAVIRLVMRADASWIVCASGVEQLESVLGGGAARAVVEAAEVVVLEKRPFVRVLEW